MNCLHIRSSKLRLLKGHEKVFLKKDMDDCVLSPHQEFKIKTTERSQKVFLKKDMNVCALRVLHFG